METSVRDERDMQKEMAEAIRQAGTARDGLHVPGEEHGEEEADRGSAS